MRKSLYRSETFPHDEEREIIRNYFLETNEGNYVVKVEDDSDEFVLTVPNGDRIHDHISEIHNRRALYWHYENGSIYEWLVSIGVQIDKAWIKDGIVQKTVMINDLRYSIRICASTKEVWIELPKEMRWFYTKDTYEACKELPLLKDGKIEYELRKLCKQYGLDLPAPYKVGIGVLHKKESSNNEKAK